MRAIGFRVEAAGINWAVVSGDPKRPEPVEHDLIRAPKTGTEATNLSYFRERVLALVKRLQPTVAMIRYPEPSRQKASSATSADARLRIEGVVLEALSSANVTVYTGALSPIASMIGSKKPREYLSRDDIRGVQYPLKAIECRESFLAAVAALSKGNADGRAGSDEVPQG